MWILHPGNAALLGIGPLPPDHLRVHRFAMSPESRREVLLWAMELGLMRVRGHGAVTTFEFTSSTVDALRAAQPFMRANFGPFMGCRFNNVATGESFGGLFRDISSPAASLPNGGGFYAVHIHPDPPERG